MEAAGFAKRDALFFQHLARVDFERHRTRFHQLIRRDFPAAGPSDISLSMNYTSPHPLMSPHPPTISVSGATYVALPLRSGDGRVSTPVELTIQRGEEMQRLYTYVEGLW